MSRQKRQYVVTEPTKSNQIETGVKFKLNKERTTIYQWNDWFAWYPVFVHGNFIWLKHIERKYVYKMNTRESYYCYRLKGMKNVDPGL